MGLHWIKVLFERSLLATDFIHEIPPFRLGSLVAATTTTAAAPTKNKVWCFVVGLGLAFLPTLQPTPMMVQRCAW